MLPAAGMAPDAASNASARLVLPLPACPTSASVRIRLMECATGAPPGKEVSRYDPGFSISILEDFRKTESFSAGAGVRGLVLLRGRRCALLGRAGARTPAALLRHGDRAGCGNAADDQPLGFDEAGEEAAVVGGSRDGVERARIQHENLGLLPSADRQAVARRAFLRRGVADRDADIQLGGRPEVVELPGVAGSDQRRSEKGSAEEAFHGRPIKVFSNGLQRTRDLFHATPRHEAIS